MTMVYQMKNYNDEHKSEAKIIVASNATFKGGKINNCAGAVIDVKGKLVDGIYNAGVINVIEIAIVIVDDIYENAAGIIDVTKANAGKSHRLLSVSIMRLACSSVTMYSLRQQLRIWQPLLRLVFLLRTGQSIPLPLYGMIIVPLHLLEQTLPVRMFTL